MARRRLNRTFVIAAAAAVGVAGVGGVAWRKFRPKDAARLAAAGEMYARQGDLPASAAAYNAAVNVHPTDAQLHLKLGWVYYRMRDQDYAHMVDAAVAEWTRAEELQPDLTEAWQGLLEANLARALGMAQAPQQTRDFAFQLPEQFGRARAAAVGLLKLDPADAKARAAMPILSVNLWLAKLAIPLSPQQLAEPVDRRPTEPQLVEQAVADLTAVMRDHPDDADVPFWIARAKIGQGLRLAEQAAAGGTAGGTPGGGTAGAAAGGTDPAAVPASADPMADARALFAEAVAVFDDPIRRRPHLAQLYSHKAEILAYLAQIDRSPESAPGYQKQLREALDRAQAEVTPADGPVFVASHAAWADYLAGTDPAAAEAEYKRLLAPPAGQSAGTDVQRLMEDAHVRLQYALMLRRDPARRGDAVKVLDPVPTSPPADVPDVARPNVVRLLADARLLRAGLLTDLLAAAPNPSAKADLAGRAAAEVDGVAAVGRFAGSYEVLKARGRLSLATGAFRDAIQQLSAAADLQATSGRPTDYDLLTWEANAYAGGHQDADAVKLLVKTLADPASANVPRVHQLLAGLYLQNGDYDHAREQVAWLSERDPDDPSTLHLQIQALGHEPDPKAVTALYDRLPERTLAQRLDKADWALQTANPADAERLYEAVLKGRPGEPYTAVRLADLYAADGDRGRANAVLQAAIDAHPDGRASLQLAKDRVNGVSEAVLLDEAGKQIALTKDPLTRELAYYHLADARHDLPGQIDHLERAAALQPDGREVLDKLFMRYLAAGRYDTAAALLPHLGQLDADSAHGLLFKFRLAMAKGDPAGAEVIGEQLTHDLPQIAASWASLGQAQQASGRFDLAAQQYAAALDRQANDPDTVARLVACLTRQGKLDEARHALADARTKFPDARVYRQQAVQLELTFGDPERVLPLVDELVATHPEVADSWQLAVQTYAAAAQRHAARADATGAAGLSDRSRSLLADAVKRFPDNPTFAAELADLQSHDGTDDGRAAAADTLAALGRTDRWRDRPLPGLLLGRMYLSVHRPDLAEPPLRQAVDLAPGVAEPRLALADDLVALRRPDDALAALAPVNGQPAVRPRYVDLLLALGRGDQARAELAADLAAHPDDPAPANLLAHVYAAQGKWDDARATADRALAVNPKDLAAYYIRGVSEAERPAPDLVAAAADLTVFRNAYPDNQQGRLALAGVLTASHDVDGATRELEAAVDRNPDAKDARLLLARAYLAAVPPRTSDAQRVIAATLALPPYAHDADVQRVASAVYLQQGDGDRAVAAIRDAVAHAPDQSVLLGDYLDVLLATKHYDLLLDEAGKATGAAVAAWVVPDYQGRAKAAAGDPAGAADAFTTALDRAGAAPTLAPSLAVAGHAVASLGLDRAAALIEPRSHNSAAWRAVLAGCYAAAGSRDRALPLAESALAAIDAFAPADRPFVTRLAATLYMTAVPPQGGRALPLFQDLLKRAPDDVDALNNVACILNEMVVPPRPRDALAYSGHAMDVVRHQGRIDPFVYDTHAWDLIQAGQVDPGIDLLHGIIDRADFPDAHYHLAVGYLRKRRPDLARPELAAAAAVYHAAVAAGRVVDLTLPDKIAAATADADRLAPAGTDR